MRGFTSALVAAALWIDIGLGPAGRTLPSARLSLEG